jgi:uncharacterized caspase-like protein
MHLAMQSLLGASRDNITDLTSDGAPDRQPTRRNIVASLEAIAKKAQSGDLVVVFFAGQGAQIPDTSVDESDGLDEVFLPQDTSTWDERTKTIQSTLLEFETNALAEEPVGAAQLDGHGSVTFLGIL